MCVSAMSVCVSWAVSQGAEVKAYSGRAYPPPRLPAMSIDPSILVSIRTSVRVSIHISIHMSIHMSIRMSVHMSIRMSTHMSIADGCYCRTRWHDVNFGYEAPVVFHVKEVEVALVFFSHPSPLCLGHRRRVLPPGARCRPRPLARVSAALGRSASLTPCRGHPVTQQWRP